MSKFFQFHWHKVFFVIILLVAVYFRFINLSSLPPSPYWEEVALGYDAYSILKTGMDHHGNPFPVVAFESFGDWKPSLYFYSIVPFISVFDLSVLAVRLPSALAGLMIVIGSGLLAKYLVDFKTSNTKSSLFSQQVQLSTMFVVAVSPWAIMFSRAGWEANLATALILWGVISLLKSQKDSKFEVAFAVLGAVLLALATYTYHAAKFISPLLFFMSWAYLVFTCHHYRSKKLPTLLITIKRTILSKQFLFSVMVFFLILTPILLSITSGKITNRFATESIFTHLDIIEQSNSYKEIAHNFPFSRLIFHRYVLFGREVVSNFVSHFDLNFLFVHGDSNPRHSSQFTGLFYYADLLFLLIGSYWLFRNRRLELLLLFGWLVIGIFPTSVVIDSPHALRILPTAPVWFVIIGIGLLVSFLGIRNFVEKILSKLFAIRQSKSLSSAIVAMGFLSIYIVQLTFFWQFYSKVYPVIYESNWQYGYKEMVESVSLLQKQNPNAPVYIDRAYGRPAMYYWFFTKEDPVIVQSREKIEDKEKQFGEDQNEFFSYKNIIFYRPTPAMSNCPCILAVASSNKTVTQASELTPSSTIYSLADEPIWQIYLVK